MFSRLITLLLLLTSLPIAAENWSGADYNVHSTCQQEWAFNFLRTIELYGDERVLDVGCGSGLITAALAAGLPEGRVVGIDLSRSMVSFAQAHFKERNLSYMHADARALPFHQEFDLVVSFACLHWVNPLDQALLSMRNSLRPCGRIAACIGGYNPLIEAIYHTMEQAPWNEYVSDFDRGRIYRDVDSVAALLKAVAFKPLRVEEVRECTPFPDRASFSLWVSQWLHSEKELPPELRSTYRDAIIDRYLAQTPALDPSTGTITMIQNMVHVVAKK